MQNNMEAYAYEALRAVALTHRYNQWIYDLFKPYMGKNLLEVGCGIGNMSRYFKQQCDRFTAVDICDSFLKHIKIDFPELELHKLDIASKEVLALKDKNFDTITCVNVLEHIKDDNAAIKNMYELLLPGGSLLIFVPAMKILYGAIDKNVDHFRRYDKAELKTQLEAAGFKIKTLYFTNYLGVFGWFVNGRILNRKHFPVLQPLIFDKMIPFISVIEKYIRLPFGMTLVAVAVKPEQA